jgi:hypothetical protein
MGDGDFRDRHWPHAPDGWFSWEVRVLTGKPQQVRVAYWGSDVGRVFDVLVDGEKIATQRLQNNKPDQFHDEVYLLAIGKTHAGQGAGHPQIPSPPRQHCGRRLRRARDPTRID